MSIIFEGIEMPTACCFVDGEHSAFAHFEYCKFYNICKKRDTIKTNCKPGDCPVKALEQEPKRGHWIETAEEYYKAVNEKGGGVNEDTEYFTDDIACSECLAKFSVIDNEAERFDFCPYCGSDNK